MRARDARTDARDLPDGTTEMPATRWHDGQIKCDVTEVADNELSRSIVIPGRIEDASPESIRPHDSWEKWIPGLRLAAHPGMTAL